MPVSEACGKSRCCLLGFFLRCPSFLCSPFPFPSIVFPNSTVNFFPGAFGAVPNEPCGDGCKPGNCLQGETTACGHDGHYNCTLFTNAALGVAKAGKAVACVQGQHVGQSFEVTVKLTDDAGCVNLPAVGAWSKAEKDKDLVVIASDLNTSVSFAAGHSMDAGANLCDPRQCTAAAGCILGNATGKASRNGETAALVNSSASLGDVFGKGVACAPKVHPVTGMVVLVPSGVKKLAIGNATHLIAPTATSCAVGRQAKVTLVMTPAKGQRAVFTTSTSSSLSQMPCVSECVEANGCYTRPYDTILSTPSLAAVPTDKTTAVDGKFGSCATYTYLSGPESHRWAGSHAFPVSLENQNGDTEWIGAGSSTPVVCTMPKPNHVGRDVGLSLGIMGALLAAAVFVQKRRANELGKKNVAMNAPLLPTSVNGPPSPVNLPPVEDETDEPDPVEAQEEEGEEEEEEEAPSYEPPSPVDPPADPPADDESDDDDLLADSAPFDSARPKFGTAQAAALRKGDPRILVGETVRVNDVEGGRVGKVVDVIQKYGMSSMHSIIFEDGDGQPELILLRKQDGGKRGAAFHVLHAEEGR